MTPQEENKKLLDFAKKLQIWTVTGVALGFPWIIFPLGFEFYESAKAIFFIVATLLLAISWSLRIVGSKKLVILKTPLNYLLLIWVVVNIASTLLSLDPVTSVWGYSSRFVGGLIFTITTSLFTFFVINGVEEYRDYAMPVRALTLTITFYSIAIIGQYINGYLGILNPIYDRVAATLNLVNASFLKTISFSTIGSSAVVPFILLVLLPIISNRYFSENSKFSLFSSIVTIIAISITASSLGPIYTIIIPLFFIAIIATYIFFYRDIRSVIFQKVVLVGIIFVTSFLVFNLNYSRELGVKGYTVNPPVEFVESVRIAANTLGESPKNILLGSGPDTFIYNFGKFRSEEFNESPYWNLRFSRSGSQLIETFQTLGVVGLVSWLGIVTFLIYFVIKKIVQSKTASTNVDLQILGISITVILVFFASIVVFFNAVMWFIFWFCAALTIGAFYQLNPSIRKEHVITFPPDDESLILVPQFIFSIIVILCVVVFYFVGRNFVADVYLRNSVNSSVKAFVAKEQDDLKLQCTLFKDAYDQSERAYSLAGYKDYVTRYHALMAYYYGTYLFNLQKDETLEENCPGTPGAFFYLAKAETSIRGDEENNVPGVLDMNDVNVENHQTAVKVFSGLVGMIPDFNEKYSTDTSNALIRAINLDPLTPDNWLNLGIFLYSAAVTESSQDEAKAISLIELANDYFKHAYELRPTYLRTILIVTQSNILYSREEQALQFLNENLKLFERDTEEYNKVREWRDIVQATGAAPRDNQSNFNQSGDNNIEPSGGIDISDDDIRNIENLND